MDENKFLNMKNNMIKLHTNFEFEPGTDIEVNFEIEFGIWIQL